ncbi:hypothetical protein, partial [Bacillus sp. OK048]|uniref:hypothetical protein n=1 Tax=Bacillus sp. OK048 TaxID=1882761 RepID=UPI001C31DD41
SATKSMHTKKEEFPPPLIITRVILRLFQQSRNAGLFNVFNPTTVRLGWKVSTSGDRHHKYGGGGDR